MGEWGGDLVLEKSSRAPRGFFPFRICIDPPNARRGKHGVRFSVFARRPLYLTIRGLKFRRYGSHSRVRSLKNWTKYLQLGKKLILIITTAFLGNLINYYLNYDQSYLLATTPKFTVHKVDIIDVKRDELFFLSSNSRSSVFSSTKRELTKL